MGKCFYKQDLGIVYLLTYSFKAMKLPRSPNFLFVAHSDQMYSEDCSVGSLMLK